MKPKIKLFLLLAISLLIADFSKAQTSWLHTVGEFRSGIPNGGFGGASANTGSILFYNATNTNTVKFLDRGLEKIYCSKLHR